MTQENKLKKARANNLTLGGGNILSEIVEFLKKHKAPASPKVIADALSVPRKKVRTTMQKSLSLADGKKADVNSGIIELSDNNGGGFVRLTKEGATEEDSSKNRYEWKRNIPTSW